MKQVTIVLFMLVVALNACHDVKIGYLQVEGARYVPDSLVIRMELGDDRYDENRIANNAPWVSGIISGVLGTQPLQYSLVGVKALNGTEEDARTFASELIVRGNGRMEVPLKPSAPGGHYVVTLRVDNEDYSATLEDIFTFIIK